MILWLFGDSIFHGAISETAIEAGDPLWSVRAPAPMLDLMAGRPFARLGGGTMVPDGIDKACGRISEMVGRDIAVSDAVAMLDVGPHSGDPDLHERQWFGLRSATASHPGVVLICEGFDNGAQGRPNHNHRQPIGNRSPNDAIRAAASAPMPEAGRTVFVPTSKPLLRYHHALDRETGSAAFRRDGIHLNVWGQARLCWLLLEALGRADDEARKRWTAFAAAAWRALDAPDAATAIRIAELACEPSEALYPATEAAR